MTDSEVLNKIYDLMLFNASYLQIYLGVIFGALIAIIIIIGFNRIR